MAKRPRKRDPKPPPAMPKAYGYVRVSTEDQAREGISLEAQIKKIEAWAFMKDLDLIHIYKDEGYSGKDMNRPALNQLVELVQGHEAEAVIVYKLDRLTRRTSDLLHLIEEVFHKGNTRFFSITEQIDTDTAMGKFFLTIMGAMAQMERELISERTSMALQHKKERGESLGLVPYGYEQIDGQLVPNAEEGKVLRRMKRWRKEGLSYAKIAKRLNEQGVLPRRKKAKWHSSSVYYILKRTMKNIN